MHMRRLSSLFVVLVVSLLLALASLPAQAQADTVLSVLEKQPDLSTLVTAIKAAGLDSALNDPQQSITLFAPTNAVFAEFPEKTLTDLLADKTALTQLLTYHVVAGSHSAADICTHQTLKTVQGQNLQVKNGKGVTIGNANVVSADIVTDNGIIHVIDTVLIPA